MKRICLNKKAQNIIEYAVLFAAVVSALIIFLPKSGGGYSQSVNTVLEQPLKMMDKAQGQDFSK